MVRQINSFTANSLHPQPILRERIDFTNIQNKENQVEKKYENRILMN